MLAGIILIVQKSYPLSVKYGGWDAWSIWNLHGRYMAAGPGKWTNIFMNDFTCHPDYPLLIPGITGFFIRCLGRDDLIAIPFIFSISITIFIPLLIYLEFVKKNMIVAALALFIFAQDSFYLTMGVSEYADAPLAFFFLCAMICSDHIKDGNKYLSLCAFCLGCCIWTKNEGAILAVVFILFNLKTFFSRKNIRYFAAGIALPLAVEIIHKVFYAPANNLSAVLGPDIIHRTFEQVRYEALWKAFAKCVDEKFGYVKPAFLGYILICILQKKWPGRKAVIILCCLVAYVFIFISIIPGDQFNWELDTAFDRLLLQLIPAAMYVFTQRFSDVRFSLAKQEVH
jgi:hypothetical protein